MDSSLSSLANSETLSLRGASSLSSRYPVRPIPPKPINVREATPAEDPLPEETLADAVEESPAAAPTAAIEESLAEPITTNPIEEPMLALAATDADVEEASVAIAVVPAAPEGVDTTLCPRCGGKLMNPQELGWCPKCRYCRSLESEQAATNIIEEPKTTKVSPLGVVEFIEFARKLPSWAYVLPTGVISILALSLIANATLPSEACFERAVISAIIYPISLVTLLLVNVWSITLLAPKDDQLGAKDVFLCSKLWRAVCKHLPEMRWQLYLGAWALTALLCALVLIRGTDYWILAWQEQFMVDKANKAAKDLENLKKVNDRSLEDAVRDMANTQSVSERAGGSEATKKDRKSLDKGKNVGIEQSMELGEKTARCMVVGFTVSSGRVSGLVLASQEESGPKYVGVVRQGWTSREATLLLAQLTPLAQSKGPIPGVPVRATWVKPDIFCRVTFEGRDDQGMLEDARFKELYVSTTRSVIIGYMVDDKEQLKALVLASVLGNRMRYAGTISQGITVRNSAELLNRLKPLVQAEAPIPGLELDAHWLKPAAFCEIAHDGFDENYQFLNPRYRSLVKSDKEK